MIQSNNKRLIYYLFTFSSLCASVIFSIRGYEIKRKIDLINTDPIVICAVISEEFIENIGDKQTISYKLSYSLKNKLYVKRPIASGNYKSGEKIKILAQRDNPDNYIILSDTNYKELWIYSFVFFIIFIILIIYRNKIISAWRKITPDYIIEKSKCTLF